MVELLISFAEVGLLKESSNKIIIVPFFLFAMTLVIPSTYPFSSFSSFFIFEIEIFVCSSFFMNKTLINLIGCDLPNQTAFPFPFPLSKQNIQKKNEKLGNVW